MKIALVYDRVNKFGGAERVLLALHEIWPQAPLYTTVYNPTKAPWAKVFNVKTSFLQNIPFAKDHHEWFAWLTPLAFSKFNFDEFDIVISVTSAEAKHIKTGSQTLHICYCLTPTRYLWSHRKSYEREGIKGLFLKLLGPFLRQTDFKAIQNIDHFIAISTAVSQRIKRYYHQDSRIIFPPVELSEPKTILPIKTPKRFYLVVSRLVSYKRVDLAIKVCNKLQRNLIIVGSGEQEKRLRKLVGKTIYFVGNLTDDILAMYYKRCQAVLFAGYEDFGIVPVEAMSFGKPVIAFAKGGVLDTIISNKTGILFKKQSVSSLEKALLEFEKKDFSAQVCKAQAQKFSKTIFKNNFAKIVEELWRQNQKSKS
ncbi:glycosyltransferase family 4 protein [Candidatus Beckwithbacteria bacterium]|nr:glycosyltransferase family 4 protein [Candidatus Beckwithbacteria bacterium]